MQQPSGAEAGPIAGGSLQQISVRRAHRVPEAEMREVILMGHTVAQKIAGLPADRRRRIHARARELIVEELTLWRRDLRRALPGSSVPRRLPLL